MADFKRVFGQTLGLRLSLFPADDTKFVRAFLTDKDGSNLSPSEIDLINTGNGNYVNNTFTMPSVSQVHAKYIVYSNSSYTEIDCEFPGGSDVFDLEVSVGNSGISGSEEVSVKFSENANLKANLKPGDLKTLLKSDEISVRITPESDISAKLSDGDLGASISSDEIKADLD